jgi:hypothetical protein
LTTRKTQRAAILNLLIRRRPDWVSLPELMEIAAQYNARLFEIRHDLGFEISNRIEVIDGVRHSWFRLESGSNATPKIEPDKSPTLFEVGRSFEYPD